jgi:hypothetical protein
VSLGGLTGTLQVFEGWDNNMAIKQKFLIVWIIAAIVATFLAFHASCLLRAGLEHAIACGSVSPALLGKFAAAFFGFWHS